MKKVLVLLSSMLLMCAVLASSDEVDRSGRHLLQDINATLRIATGGGGADRTTVSYDELASSSHLLGYVVGVSDGLAEAGMLKCLPQHVSAEEMLRVTKKYLEENPQMLHEDQTTLITAALTKAYPCK